MSLRTILALYSQRRNLRREPEELKKTQRKMLKAVLSYAYDNVRFYHEKFRDANVTPADVNSIDDLAKIPLTTKTELQSSPNDILARGTNPGKCLKKSTSGSTGIPLNVFLSRKAAYFRRALWFRAYLENGLRIMDRVATIGAPRGFPKKQLLGRFQIPKRVHVSVFEERETQLKILESFRPDALKSYPSTIIPLADLCKESGSHLKLRLIFTTGGVLGDQHRRSINSCFDSEILDNYAALEFGLLAWECRSHMGYHTNVDGVVTEFIRDDEPVSAGERGEVVCTGLVNYAMPLIRYKLEDVCIPSDERCACGITLPLIRNIEGRANDFLRAMDGTLISPGGFFPYPFVNGVEGIKQLRIIQERRDKLTIQLVLKESFSPQPEFFGGAESEIHRLFGKGMNVEFKILDKIDLGLSGKLNMIVSHVEDY